MISATGSHTKFPTDPLNVYVFETLDEVRHMTADWLVRYNQQRPHESWATYRHDNT